MKIGIIGTRGIPNHYGGFEQLAEYLSVRLVKRGHSVTVYNSSLHPYLKTEYKGVAIVSCNDPENYLGTAGQFIYDLNCIRHARKQNYDVILQLGYTSSSIWSFLFPENTKIVTNMDGLEWQRSKYNAITRLFLKKAEHWAIKASHLLVADSLGIKNYLKEAYKEESVYIAYGAELPQRYMKDFLEELNLEENGYYLVIARLEPENNIETIIKGYLRSQENTPLLIVGAIKTDFGKYLQQSYASEKVLFKGAIYNKEKLDVLRHFCKLYFHGHSVGGTNPSLLEAMAASSKIAAHDNVFNRSVLENDALYFKGEEDVAGIILDATAFCNNDAYTSNNRKKIETLFGWEYITDLYEQQLKQICKNEA